MRRLIAAALLLLASSSALADDAARAARMRATATRTDGERVVVWTDDSWMSAERTALAMLLDDTVVRVEKHLGRPFDAKGYGQDRIEYFILGEKDRSHVMNGYHHAAGDKPYVFLAGVREGLSPYVHETVHIVAGPFGSLLLREGLATQVHLALAGKAMRPLSRIGSLDALHESVRSTMKDDAKRKKIEGWLANPEHVIEFASPEERSLLYATGAALVDRAIARLGMAEFMKLYASPEPQKHSRWPELDVH